MFHQLPSQTNNQMSRLQSVFHHCSELECNLGCHRVLFTFFPKWEHLQVGAVQKLVQVCVQWQSIPNPCKLGIWQVHYWGHNNIANHLINICCEYLLPTMLRPRSWPGCTCRSTGKSSHMSSWVWAWLLKVCVVMCLYTQRRTCWGVKRKTLRASSWLAILRSIPFTCT